MFGDHRTACSTSSVLKRRAGPAEKTWARVCREAKGLVRERVPLKELNLPLLQEEDGRQLEVEVTGLPLYHGQQLALDATLVAPLTRSGEPRPKAWHEDGAALTEARKRKERRYPELLQEGSRCRLVVLETETRGRWSEEAFDFVDQLARATARSAPPALRTSAWLSWLRRWTSLVSVAAQDSLATTLLTGDALGFCHLDGTTPELCEVLGADRWAEAPSFSRLAAA